MYNDVCHSDTSNHEQYTFLFASAFITLPSNSIKLLMLLGVMMSWEEIAKFPLCTPHWMAFRLEQVNISLQRSIQLHVLICYKYGGSEGISQHSTSFFILEYYQFVKPNSIPLLFFKPKKLDRFGCHFRLEHISELSLVCQALQDEEFMSFLLDRHVIPFLNSISIGKGGSCRRSGARRRWYQATFQTPSRDFSRPLTLFPCSFQFCSSLDYTMYCLRCQEFQKV